MKQEAELTAEERNSLEEELTKIELDDSFQATLFLVELIDLYPNNPTLNDPELIGEKPAKRRKSS